GAAPPLRTGRAFDSYAEDGLSAPFQAAFAPSGPAIRRCSYREGVHCAGRCFIPVGAAPRCEAEVPLTPMLQTAWVLPSRPRLRRAVRRSGGAPPGGVCTTLADASFLSEQRPRSDAGGPAYADTHWA